ncbi:helix-turn-helix domain-containing protein [Chitinibacter sp. S2-10]|uniref:helix-turn-helix domain-containing protein n=1 Tax=Chitinibacter sp. S2-10 TaxID=3373597 RepID=UPI0039775314
MPRFDAKQLNKETGRLIAQHRLASGLTQEQVAEKLGIGNEAISRIERGLVSPTIERLMELAEIFDCDATAMIQGLNPHSTGQAQHLANLLAPLQDEDRQALVLVIETLANRFAASRKSSQ